MKPPVAKNACRPDVQSRRPAAATLRHWSLADFPLAVTLAHQVKELHAHALVLGGVDGMRSEQLLASAVFQPQQSAFGEDAYPSVPDKAAA